MELDASRSAQPLRSGPRRSRRGPNKRSEAVGEAELRRRLLPAAAWRHAGSSELLPITAGVTELA